MFFCGTTTNLHSSAPVFPYICCVGSSKLLRPLTSRFDLTTASVFISCVAPITIVRLRVTFDTVIFSSGPSSFNFLPLIVTVFADGEISLSPVSCKKSYPRMGPIVLSTMCMS